MFSGCFNPTLPSSDRNSINLHLKAQHLKAKKLLKLYYQKQNIQKSRLTIIIYTKQFYMQLNSSFRPKRETQEMSERFIL